MAPSRRFSQDPNEDDADDHQSHCRRIKNIPSISRFSCRPAKMGSTDLHNYVCPGLRFASSLRTLWDDSDWAWDEADEETIIL